MQLKFWLLAGHDIVKPEPAVGEVGETVGLPSPVFTGGIVVVTVEVVVVDTTEYDSIVFAARQWLSVSCIATHSAVYEPAGRPSHSNIALFPTHFTQSHSLFRPFA